ncbi:hypothetical protein ANO14919_122310 [Xylariales sp. No.14919]|nr:hypothetical protein ANO14919_122310 [Xylariales sp. No.14919]
MISDCNWAPSISGLVDAITATVDVEKNQSTYIGRRLSHRHGSPEASPLIEAGDGMAIFHLRCYSKSLRSPGLFLTWKYDYQK